MKRGREKEFSLGVLSWTEERMQEEQFRKQKSQMCYISQRRASKYVVTYPSKEYRGYGLYFHKTFTFSIKEAFEFASQLNLPILDRGESLKFAPLAKARAREAIHSWSLCALRLGVPRDVRNLVAREIYKLSKFFV